MGWHSRAEWNAAFPQCHVAPFVVRVALILKEQQGNRASIDSIRLFDGCLLLFKNA